jgi:hypothetical protein
MTNSFEDIPIGNKRIAKHVDLFVEFEGVGS